MGEGRSAPELIVFDLDFTLWDCGGLWVDCVRYPFREDANRILDRDGRVMRLYEEVPAILDEVEEAGISMALASRSEQPGWARDLLDLMGIRSRFDHEQIFPGSKVAHFSRLAEDTGIPFERMMFFDDEHRNIVEVGELGVHCIEVRSGLDRSTFEQGWTSFPG